LIRVYPRFVLDVKVIVARKGEISLLIVISSYSREK